MNKNILSGVVHLVPADFKTYLLKKSDARDAWENITPLARNEWICWIESAKKQETRNRRIQRALEDLSGGKRRPCCWAGCIHR